MKGATTLPLLRTISPPNTTIMNRMGSIQYFLRARMKDQSSEKNIPMAASELVLHCFGSGAGRLACDPIAHGVLVEGKIERSFSQYSHDQPGGYDSDKKHQAE